MMKSKSKWGRRRKRKYKRTGLGEVYSQVVRSSCAIMRRKVISSWRSTADGSVEEAAFKICVNEEDATYEVELVQIPEMVGLYLGEHSEFEQYTAIHSISEANR